MKYFFALSVLLVLGCKSPILAAPPGKCNGAPSISQATPNSGPIVGGTAVTISGNNFCSGASISFGGASGSSVTVTSNTSLTVTAPSHSSGVVSIVITNPNGKSGTLSNSFTYNSLLAYSPLAASIGTAPSGVVGQSLSFNASVTGGSAPYSYLWQFADGGTASVNPATHTYLVSGSYNVVFTVTDAKGNIANSSFSVDVSGSTLKASNTILASSVNPATVGQAVSFIAAVAPAVSNRVVPTGTVTFAIDGASQIPTPLIDGIATLKLNTLSAGIHTVVASYSGDSGFASSSSPSYSQNVNQNFVLPWVPSGSLNVTQHGVVGDGVTDNTAALQSLADTAPQGTLFYFPAGIYAITNTINFARLVAWGMLGDVTSAGLSASTIKITTTNKTGISVDYGDGQGVFQIKNMRFVASSSGGTGFYDNNTINASFENCSFSGYVGLYERSPFKSAIRGSQFVGDSTAGSIGFFGELPTETLISESDFSGWGEGFRAAGSLSAIRSTFEHNEIGMRLGGDMPEGNNWSFGRASMRDLVFTDNGIAVFHHNASNILYSNVVIHGTSNAPGGQSRYGFYESSMGQATFADLKIDGGFSGSSIYMRTAGNSTFYAPSVTNSLGVAWASNAGLVGVPFTDLHDYTPLSNVTVTSTTLPSQVNVDDVTASHVVSGSQDLVLNVTAYGAIGNGSTDNTAALQALINSATQGATFYFPKGTYLVTSTLDFSRLKNFSITGDSAGIGGNGSGSSLRGNFSSPLMKVDYQASAGTFHINNINLFSSVNAGGIALYARNAVLSSIQNVQANGNIGISLENPFKVSLSSLNSIGDSLQGIGLMVNGGYGCTVESSDFMGLQEGMRVGGSTNFANYASRYETNLIGVNLGVNPSNAVSTLTGASLEGFSMEANNYHIVAKSCSNCSFAAIGTQGSIGAPAGLSITGLSLDDVRNSTLSSIQIGGAYSGYAIGVLPAASNVLFTDSLAGNGGSGLLWNIQSTNNITLNACQ